MGRGLGGARVPRVSKPVLDRNVGGEDGRHNRSVGCESESSTVPPRSPQSRRRRGSAGDGRPRSAAGLGGERAAAAQEPAHRPRRDPSRDRHRARRQQPRRVLLRPRDSGRPADRARRLQGRERRDEASGRALPDLRTRRARAGGARAHRATTPTIEWTVHLANKKASWYQFETALDIPEAEPTSLRNPAYRRRLAPRADDRSRAAPRSLDATPARVPFDTGSFLGQPVYLGELRTDEEGRLLVLGGRGRSFSPNGLPLTTFANNDGWTDDTSDGPVTARVRLGRVELPVDPAWVVVAPPNYGPALATDFGTLYDVIYQTMLELGWVTPPAAGELPRRHLPALRPPRGSAVGQSRCAEPLRVGFARAVPVARDTSPDSPIRRRPTRPSAQALFARFRNPDYATLESGVDLLPPLYGDAITLPPVSPRSYLAVQPFQYAALQRWAAGDFVPGVAGPDRRRGSRICRSRRSRRRSIAPRSRPASATPSIPAARQPGRCASPRCTPSPFRLLHRKAPEPDYGNVLDAGGRAVRRWSARRQPPRRRHALDGGAVAGRHRELPLRLSVRRHAGRSVSADVLGGARAQPRDARAELRARARHLAAARRAARGVLRPGAVLPQHRSPQRHRRRSRTWSTTGTGSASSPSSRDRAIPTSRRVFKVETDNEFPTVMRVAVVGSGPAGCAAAIALCRAGRRRRPDRRRAGRRRRAAPPRGATAARAARPRAPGGAARLRRRARGVALEPSCTSSTSSRIRSATAGCSIGRASARRCASAAVAARRACCARPHG